MKPLKNIELTGRAPSGFPASSHCAHVDHVSATGPVRTVLDDSGMIAIKAWTCALCGNLVEELQVLSRPPVRSSVPTQYVVPLKDGRKRRLSGSIRN